MSDVRACKKHLQRKRPNSCPDCAQELALSKPIIAGLSKVVPEPVEDDMKWKEAPVVEKITEAVIKKKREILREQIAEVPVVFNCLEEHREDVNTYFELKLQEFKMKIKNISLVKYENLYIPRDKFTITLMEKLNREGWRLINFWEDNVAKVSSAKGACAVLERVQSENNKPKPVYTF